ncbi:uncharacterized protein LOC144636321 isoform X1 [Oculina patagonica]
MYSILIRGVQFYLLCFLIPKARCFEDQCRQLEFKAEHAFEGKRLINHVIRVLDVMMADFCDALCYMEHNCASFNVMLKSDSQGNKCELNNSTHEGYENDLEENPNYVYRGTKSACVSNPCADNSTCQTGFTDKGYRCLCTAGFEGHECQNDINECNTLNHDCSADALCDNTKGSYNCYCKSGYSGDGRTCDDFDECALETHDCSTDAVCNNNNGSYICYCKPGYNGDGRICEDIDECTALTHDCSADALCINTKGSYSCSCKPGYSGDGRNCEVVLCKELYKTNVSNETNPYCGLGECGVGPWTLVMKIDGTKGTFSYNSNLWSNMETFNPEGGETVFDTQETKLETYWNTPFSKLCLGMNIYGEENTNFVYIDKTSDSLYSLIADGQFRATSLSRDTWKSLIGHEASLQLNCSREGFNAACYLGSSKARIGFLGNDQNDCGTCDSRIGFGTGGYPDDSNTCGNEAMWSPDNGDKHIKAMGYVFVQ